MTQQEAIRLEQTKRIKKQSKKINRSLRLRKMAAWMAILIGFLLVFSTIWHICMTTKGTVRDKELDKVYADYISSETSDVFDVPASVNLTGLENKGISAIGFLKCDAMNMMQPIMQGTDNLVYRDLLPDDSHSPLGSLFLDSGEPTDMSSNNLIIYGTGKRLSWIRTVNNAKGTTHKEVLYLYTGTDIRQFQVVSVHSLQKSDTTLTYGDIDVADLLQQEKRRSNVATNTIADTAQLLTLVCLPDHFWQKPVVLTAALVGVS